MVALASRMLVGFSKYKDKLDRHCLTQVEERWHERKTEEGERLVER
jgi:hypothetical protein